LESEPGKVAKLSSKSDSLQFAAAVTAMSLGTSRRLSRNFSYYKQSEISEVKRSDLHKMYAQIRHEIYTLQNLYLNDEYSASSSPFKVMLAKSILDRLEELHRNLLFFDVDTIQSIIPVIDRQRRFWQQSTEVEFYAESLIQKLESVVEQDMITLESLLKTLPDTSAK